VATQITFTNDVGEVSTASNLDGTIRWHVYERTVNGLRSVYLQRELAGVLQPEVKLIIEGDTPEVYFAEDLGGAGVHQWVIFYHFHEQLWMLRYTENEAPVTIAIQTLDLFHNALRTLPSAEVPRTDAPTIADRQAEFFGAIAPQDVYNGPLPPSSVAVAASPNPGMFRVRWRARASTQTSGNADFFSDPMKHFIAGFNVYRRNPDASIQKLNGVLVPFAGLDPTLYEFETPAAPGTYFVSQVNFRGPLMTDLVEGRVGVRDLIRTDGDDMPDVIRSVVGAGPGEGKRREDFEILFNNLAPIFLGAQFDPFNSHGPGEGFNSNAAIGFDYDTFFIDIATDPFNGHGPGEGFQSRVVQTGFGTIIIGG